MLINPKMKRQLSMTEIEEIIKEKLRNNGVYELVGEEKISEIKDKIRSIVKTKKLEEAEAQTASSTDKNTQQSVKPEQPLSTQKPENPNIQVNTTEDPERVALAKKQAELESLQKELSEKEARLKEKEISLGNKEKELSYKPELPEKLQNSAPGELIVFSENELSLGLESLSERRIRMKSNPDTKVSPHELWVKEAITRSNVYLVELKQIGQLVFDPYEGTTIFENVKSDYNPTQPSAQDVVADKMELDALDQNANIGFVDMVEPIKNVTQPIVNPGPPEPAQSMEKTGFQQMIEKIVQDELSRKSTYSLGPGPAGQGVY
jgi:hypothetical protein